MFGTVYTALAGMNAYSRGLDIISNNVANLNTPGFKVSDPVFRDIVRQHQNGGSEPEGAGVDVATTGVVFKQGDMRPTGNPWDAAIDGGGFFVLKQDGQYLFTRAGQFKLNDDGILVERATGASVMFSTEDTASDVFNINTARSYPPKATAEVTLAGTLARAGTALTYDLPNISVFDTAGASMVLRARMTRNATDPLRWTAEILNAAGTVMGSGEVNFQENGTPAEGASQVKVTIDAPSTPDFDVTFNFGAPGGYGGVTNPAAGVNSQLQVVRQDGYTTGSLQLTAFDEQGQLKLTYSNGKSKIAGALVLARFDTPEQLRLLSGGTFMAPEGTEPVLGRGLKDGLGKIVGNNVEMSNVELTQQFTDLIVMQRGYQASSQISSVANELIQTLLAMDGRR